MKRAVAIACLAALTGCVIGPRPEPAVACRIVKSTPLTDANVKDLYEVARGTPVEGEANLAYGQSITTYVLYGVAAAGMVGGLAMGFALNSASNPGARDAGWALAGGAFGLGILSIILNYTGKYTADQARIRLRAYADHCE